MFSLFCFLQSFSTYHRQQVFRNLVNDEAAEQSHDMRGCPCYCPISPRLDKETSPLLQKNVVHDGADLSNEFRWFAVTICTAGSLGRDPFHAERCGCDRVLSTARQLLSRQPPAAAARADCSGGGKCPGAPTACGAGTRSRRWQIQACGDHRSSARRRVARGRAPQVATGRGGATAL